jgi:hypothetical protein
MPPYPGGRPEIETMCLCDAEASEQAPSSKLGRSTPMRRCSPSSELQRTTSVTWAHHRHGSVQLRDLRA